MKIIQVINSLSGGGAENFVTQLTLQLINEGHDVTLVNYVGILDAKGIYLADKLKQNNVTVISLNKRSSLGKIKIPIELYKIIKRIKPDVVHSHLEQSDIFVSLSKLLLGSNKIKFIRTLHNSVAWRRAPLLVNKSLFYFFDENIGCSVSVANEFSIPTYRSKIKAINNGIDLTILNNSLNSKEYYRDQYNIPIDRKVFLTIGRFVESNGIITKGQDHIIYAANDLKQNDVEFIFLGDGPALVNLKQLSQSLGLRNCKFIGVVDNVFDYISLSDFILMPSAFEGLPIAAIESVCLGKPIITSKIGAFKTFESNSHCYIDNLDYLGVLKSINFALNNADKLALNAKNNIKHYKKIFDIKNCTALYLKIYKN